MRTAFINSYNSIERIFPFYDEAKFVGVDPTSYDFFGGHIGFETASKLNANIVTLLRHPVDRFLSVYYFWRQLHELKVERTRNTHLASAFPLEQFVEMMEQPGLNEEFYNRATWQIAYGSSLPQRERLRNQGIDNDKLFLMAITNIDSFAIVGIQENLAAFHDALKMRFGLVLNISRENTTRERVDVANVPVRTLKKIQEWTFLDIELYFYAMKRSFKLTV